MIDDLEQLLRLAARVEADAAEGYARLAERMAGIGNAEVAALFAKFGDFSQLHLAEVLGLQANELGREFDTALDPPSWPDGHSPEDPLALAPVDELDPRGAIELALETERRACDFYAAVSGQTRSERIQELSQMFAEEESEHVEHLQRWLARMDRA